VKRASLRFGKGFHVAITTARSQAATMTLGPGEKEGDATNRHRGADQWLFIVAGAGVARINGKRYPLRAGRLIVIEHGDTHEIRNTGRAPLRTLNLYVPPAYTSQGDERPAAKP
jgi:mannose-6-phosphate isomerase-like protein (cupin superfamily)